jgi:hypothetical protein
VGSGLWGLGILTARYEKLSSLFREAPAEGSYSFVLLVFRPLYFVLRP